MYGTTIGLLKGTLGVLTMGHMSLPRIPIITPQPQNLSPGL